jgi:hypothetical protein
MKTSGHYDRLHFLFMKKKYILYMWLFFLKKAGNIKEKLRVTNICKSRMEKVRHSSEPHAPWRKCPAIMAPAVPCIGI